MIYSTKLGAFIKANEPQAIQAQAPEMVQGVSAISMDEIIIYRKYETGTKFAEIYVPKKAMRIWWGATISEQGDKVIFVPALNYSRASGGEEKREVISQLVLSHLGIKPKEVALPEKVVKPPLPYWADVEAQYDFPNCIQVSKHCFISEAREWIVEFKKELKKAEEELK
jgi:hypothetical protein